VENYARKKYNKLNLPSTAMALALGLLNPKAFSIYIKMKKIYRRGESYVTKYPSGEQKE